MFDIGFFELLLIGVVGLLVLGPERLPKAARTTGLWIGKIKRSVSGMQREINAQLEAEELRQKLAEQQKKLDAGFDKARREVEGYAESPSRENGKTAEPQGSVSRTALNTDEKPKEAGEASTAKPSSTQQAEHEPTEPSTPATDSSSGDKAAPFSVNEPDASSANKDSATR